MKLYKYFLSIFAFVIAVGGAIGAAFDSFDFVVTSGSLQKPVGLKNVEVVNTLGLNCTASNNGRLCFAQTSGGSLVPTYSTAIEAQACLNPQRQP